MTVTNYRKKIKNHIKPKLGIYKLNELTPTVLQDFINGKAKQNYSRNTLAVIKRILTGSLHYAVKQNMIRYNPIDNVSLSSSRNEQFVIPRSMQHTSSVIYHELNYTEFDFHSLRHTHATMLAEIDVPPKYLQQRMGHRNLEFTMKFYLHLTEKMQEKGSDILQRMYHTGEEKKENRE